MKTKYFLIVLAIMVGAFSVGCTGDNIKSTGSFDPENVTDPVSAVGDKFVDDIRISGYILDSITLNDEELRSYEKFFKEEYGIDLSMNITLFYDRDGSNTLKMVRENPEGIFLFNFSSISQINKMISTEKILPLGDYLEDNDTWKQLPEGMKEMYSLGDGKIWVLPRGYEQILYARVYRNSVLTSLGMQIPSTPGELYETAKAAKIKSMDVGIAYMDILSFNDIFYANSTPLAKSHTGYFNTSIVYNPDTESFEDSMLKEEMNNSLNYVKALIDEGLAHSMGEIVNFGTGALKVMIDSDKYFSTYGNIDSDLFDDSAYQIGYDLTGNVKGYKIPLSYNYNRGFYVMGSETKNPELAINTFVSLFYGSKKAYFASMYGIPGESYEFEGQEIKVKNESFFSKTQFPVIKENPLLSLYNMDISSSDDTISKIIETGKESLRKKKDFIEQGLSDGKMVVYPLNLSFPEVYPQLDSMIPTHPCAQLLDMLFHDYSKGIINTEEFISEYSKSMKDVGQQQIIDDLNEKIGVKTTYSY